MNADRDTMSTVGKNGLPPRPAQGAAADGWVLVPLQPTDAMVEAGRIEGWDDPDHEASTLGHPWIREAVYEAMLAARPVAPVGPADILEQVAKGQMLEGFRQKIGQAVARVIWDERWHDLDEGSKGDAMRAAENVLLTFHAAIDLNPSGNAPDADRAVADLNPSIPAPTDKGEVERLREALRTAECALADIGDADREEGDDLAWCEARAAEALPAVRAALAPYQKGSAR